MRYVDNIYGEFDIKDPVVLDLIESDSLQRLKKIDMAGYFEPFFPGTAHNRFEHSMWVYALLKRYKASIEEQIAWLLHDISHGAFSHCLDYVFEEWSQKEHTHQDNIFEEYLKKSDISAILNKYRIDIDLIINDRNFPLKERSLPDLCADRIDYILRWALHYDKREVAEMHGILNHLKVVDNERVFDAKEYAEKFAELFKYINDLYYSDIFTAVMFQSSSDFIKQAIKQKYITKEDLYTTDHEVLDKIFPHLSSDKDLQTHRDRMNNKIPFQNNPNDYDVQVFCKNRIVDPLFIDDDGAIKKLSSVSKKRKNIVIKVKPKEYFLKFEK